MADFIPPNKTALLEAARGLFHLVGASREKMDSVVMRSKVSCTQ